MKRKNTSTQRPSEYALFTPRDVHPDEFGIEQSKAKQLHPAVGQLLTMDNQTAARIYADLHPDTDYVALKTTLNTPVSHLRWSGSDIVSTVNDAGYRRKYLLETNSCPSGSIDLPTRAFEITGRTPYETVLSNGLVPYIQEEGDLAVVFDKNRRGTRAYAQTLTNITGRPVHWSSLLATDDFRIENQQALTINNRPIAGAFRYVTQKPWERLSVDINIPMLNPIAACLAGGRNKNTAAIAYNRWNQEHPHLKINHPETTEETAKEHAIDLITQWGGVGVIKNPYSNAGQGVYTIVSQKELEEFKNTAPDDTMYIVQQLIGYDGVSSATEQGFIRHIGTAPINGRRYAYDVRVMVVSGPQGYTPVSVYGRRANSPLEQLMNGESTSWDVLGTNISVRLGQDQWRYDEEEREIVASTEEFSALGLGTHDLVEAYIQAALANRAINDLAATMVSEQGFNMESFLAVNNDPYLRDSILRI